MITEISRTFLLMLQKGGLIRLLLHQLRHQQYIIRLGYFETNSKTVIYSVTGAEVIETTLQAQDNAITISTLPKGIYILSVNNGREVETVRFIKE